MEQDKVNHPNRGNYPKREEVSGLPLPWTAHQVGCRERDLQSNRERQLRLHQERNPLKEMVVESQLEIVCCYQNSI